MLECSSTGFLFQLEGISGKFGSLGVKTTPPKTNEHGTPKMIVCRCFSLFHLWAFSGSQPSVFGGV